MPFTVQGPDGSVVASEALSSGGEAIIGKSCDDTDGKLGSMGDEDESEDDGEYRLFKCDKTGRWREVVVIPTDEQFDGMYSVQFTSGSMRKFRCAAELLQDLDGD